MEIANSAMKVVIVFYTVQKTMQKLFLISLSWLIYKIS